MSTPISMIININQKAIALKDTYNVYIGDIPSHYAKGKLFRIFAEIELFEKSKDQFRYRMKRVFDWFMTSFDITRYDQQVFYFRTASFWKRHFFCQVGKDRYDIYGHRGRKFSVYLNDRQIAWWTKDAVTWFAGDNYKITMDSDADFELISVFCLILDNAKSENKDALNINIGYLGPQAKAFDPEWRPK